jgi:hypothetical protein
VPKDVIRVSDHLLVMVVKKNGEPGIYINSDWCTRERAAKLLELVAQRLRT